MLHVVCDQCKKSQPIDRAYDWLEVNLNPDVIHFGKRIELHFCSWICLAMYALEEANFRFVCKNCGTDQIKGGIIQNATSNIL